jgi:hypothetical protein
MFELVSPAKVAAERIRVIIIIEHPIRDIVSISTNNAALHAYHPDPPDGLLVIHRTAINENIRVYSRFDGR